MERYKTHSRLCAKAAPFIPRAPLAVEVNSMPVAISRAVPFGHYYQPSHSHVGYPSQELEQGHPNNALEQAYIPPGPTNDDFEAVLPQGDRPNPVNRLLQLRHIVGQGHAPPEAYEPGHYISSSLNPTALETNPHCPPEQYLLSQINREAEHNDPMGGPRRDCSHASGSDSDISSSGGPSTVTVVPANHNYAITTLEDLVRESESERDIMINNLNANDINAQYNRPSKPGDLIPTAIYSPGGTLLGLVYYPTYRDFRSEYERQGQPQQKNQQARGNRKSSHVRTGPLVMATYTGAFGWRANPRRSYAATKFGAVGEWLLPQAGDQEGALETAAADEHDLNGVEDQNGKI
ncbi:hypothetical protein LTR84_007849 [Exophiala bonariae]|uniref:Uncharacterized protein n=1 Tax=Exophiala bonariae TaxID=1690606 RepID=A0AAV9NNN8_9EURO|nr:hypothetical protein LTR84_007849 [Exophiala bonariae]